MPNMTDHQKSLAKLDRILRDHKHAEIVNKERLKDNFHAHTVAMISALCGLLESFPSEKCVYIIEAELAELGKRARPEDIVAWIEGVGIFVIEIKSHYIQGIRSFKNNIPQVIYNGSPCAETHFIDQPRSFAYALRGCLEKRLDDENLNVPALYFAGWLPNVSQGDVLSKGAEVNPDKVWLSDMLDKRFFLDRLPNMKNLTNGEGAKRESLPIFVGLFGITSGLRTKIKPRAFIPGTLGHYIDQRNIQLKVMTREQENLAFSPRLLRGPKVIRGVAGSGKTIVLANAVADCLLRSRLKREGTLFETEQSDPRILVLCFNRALAPYLRDLIITCYNDRKPDENWHFPRNSVAVVNIDKFVFDICSSNKIRYKPSEPKIPYIEQLLQNNIECKGIVYKEHFDHVFIDEGQDIELDWYGLIVNLVKSTNDQGPSLIIFYDEAQNLYGIKRPGVGGTPPWKHYLGFSPNPMGLNTIMRTGHRNTNEILSFSFNLLLGVFSFVDPKMLEFSEITSYMKETIPDDPKINHPNAGKPCVEKIGEGSYRINFAIESGPKPFVLEEKGEKTIIKRLTNAIKIHLDQDGDNVDPRDILIMVPHHQHVKKVIEALEQVGIPCRTPIRLKSDNSHGDPRDEELFQEKKVTVSTIHSAKGYTAHICHIVFVEELAQPDTASLEEQQKARALLHVGCTRATLGLYLWGLPCPLIAEAQEALIALDEA